MDHIAFAGSWQLREYLSKRVNLSAGAVALRWAERRLMPVACDAEH